MHFKMNAATVTLALTSTALGATEFVVPIVSYGSAGWKTNIVQHDAVENFQTVTFDDNSWANTEAPYADGVPCGNIGKTVWPLNTDLLVRRMIHVPGPCTVRVRASIDNDIIAYLDGQAMSDWGRFGGCASERYIASIRVDSPGNHLLAVRAQDFGSASFLDLRVEASFTADCNLDGIVDYQQILSGQLDDDNTDGIPDLCQSSVTGIIPPSVPAQGGSLVTIKGSGFLGNPSVRIGGVAATDVVRLSSTRISATTRALNPGMASVTVNTFTLPDAIYIRPECGSDLDQNGTVDAADISIILLDFGPCYEPPAALAAPVPTPLLADEPAQKPTQR